jgi:hypothetical protein
MLIPVLTAVLEEAEDEGDMTSPEPAAAGPSKLVAAAWARGGLRLVKAKPQAPASGSKTPKQARAGAGKSALGTPLLQASLALNAAFICVTVSCLQALKRRGLLAEMMESNSSAALAGKRRRDSSGSSLPKPTGTEASDVPAAAAAAAPTAAKKAKGGLPTPVKQQLITKAALKEIASRRKSYGAAAIAAVEAAAAAAEAEEAAATPVVEAAPSPVAAPAPAIKTGLPTPVKQQLKAKAAMKEIAARRRSYGAPAPGAAPAPASHAEAEAEADAMEVDEAVAPAAPADPTQPVSASAASPAPASSAFKRKPKSPSSAKSAPGSSGKAAETVTAAAEVEGRAEAGADDEDDDAVSMGTHRLRRPSAAAAAAAAAAAGSGIGDGDATPEAVATDDVDGDVEALISPHGSSKAGGRPAAKRRAMEPWASDKGNPGFMRNRDSILYVAEVCRNWYMTKFSHCHYFICRPLAVHCQSSKRQRWRMSPPCPRPQHLPSQMPRMPCHPPQVCLTWLKLCQYLK